MESLEKAQIEAIVRLGEQLKAERRAGKAHEPVLRGQCWGMMFSKASTRTRVSFEVGLRELGAWATYFSPRDTQLGRGEPIRDTARVMGRMLSGAVIRTYAQQDVVDFAAYGNIPTINALTDDEHPCQVLADLLTMHELCGGWLGKKVVFLGDGDNNMSRSWMWASERLGFEFVIAAPPKYQPSAAYLSQFRQGTIRCEADVRQAVQGADVLYTDVWVSMGQEDDTAQRVADLAGYQINDTLVAQAAPGALVMHCLPAYREKEITDACLEKHASTIFQQSENRLHAQKAVLVLLNSARHS
jgi:ornithine carbamoyltransferase